MKEHQQQHHHQHSAFHRMQAHLSHFRRHLDDFDGPSAFGGHGGPFGGRGRGGPGRFFETGDLRFVILQLIQEAPRHGYEIIKSIQDKLGGAYAPSPGIVYPMLTMLEEMGYATVTTEGTRKLYAITPEGSQFLDQNRSITEAIFQRIKHAGARFSHGRPPEIMRAIENLKMALRMKSESLTPEKVNAIVDILDNATKQIERA